MAFWNWWALIAVMLVVVIFAKLLHGWYKK